MFGVIPGQHWRISTAASDPKLDSESARRLGGLVATKLHLRVSYVNPESKDWPVSFADIRESDQSHGLSVVLFVDRRNSTVSFTAFYSDYFGRSAGAEKIEKTTADEVLALLKQLFPASSAAPFVAYQGLLGP